MTIAPPEAKEAALEAVATLGRLVTVFAERRKQLAESVGLTDQQWQALEEVQTEHFMPSLFAHKRETSAAAVSKILRQLSDKGLIQASLSSVDGRHRSYSVTDKGRALLANLREERERAIREVWLKLELGELRAWSSLGERLASGLERLAAERTKAPEIA